MSIPRNTVPVNNVFSDWAYQLWIAGGSVSNRLSIVSEELDKIVNEIEEWNAKEEV